ncbi:MAG: helix-turn-helix domain-containing protein [Bryobacteraceae bacterium]
MQSVGKFIQQSRLQAGVSLEEISARTRISLHTLQAIEDDDLSVMPSAFFYKSFVAQFAKVLQIESSIISPLIESVLANIPDPRIPGQDERIAKGVVIRSSVRPRSFKWLYSLGSLALALVCCSGFYAFWENARGDLSQIVTNVSSKSAQSPRGVQAGVQSSAPQSSAGALAQNLAHGYRVDLSALEPTWLTVTADGKQEFSGTLEPEQKKSFEGHERGRIKTGNAGGISLVFNGKPIGVVGPRGQVRTVVFTRNNYEIIEPPASVAVTSFIQTFELMKPLRAFQR